MSQQSGDPSEIGQQFFYGVGKRSYVRALPYLLQAAKLNDPHCQNLVGYCYAELGDGWAQCNLAVAYLEGLRTKQDLAEGFKWLQKAARNGDVKAQYNLGVAYRDGEGVSRNSRQARRWLERAGKQGYKKATRALKSLSGK